MASFYSEEELKEIGFKQFGKNVLISKKASIYGAGDISLGSNVRVDDFCVLSGKIDIGSYVHISVYAGLFGGDAGIVIGDFCAVSSKVMVYAVNDDYTGIGLTNPMVPMEYRNVTEEQVILNDHCIVGSGCTVLPGVILGEGVSVGAMSLVNKSLDEWGIYVGIPAKKIKDRSKEMLKYVDKIKVD